MKWYIQYCISLSSTCFSISLLFSPLLSSSLLFYYFLFFSQLSSSLSLLFVPSLLIYFSFLTSFCAGQEVRSLLVLQRECRHRCRSNIQVTPTHTHIHTYIHTDRRIHTLIHTNIHYSLFHTHTHHVTLIFIHLYYESMHTQSTITCLNTHMYAWMQLHIDTYTQTSTQSSSPYLSPCCFYFLLHGRSFIIYHYLFSTSLHSPLLNYSNFLYLFSFTFLTPLLLILCRSDICLKCSRIVRVDGYTFDAPVQADTLPLPLI